MTWSETRVLSVVCVLSQSEDERGCIRGPGEDRVPLPGAGGGRGRGAVRPSQTLHQPPAGAVQALHLPHLPHRGHSALSRHLPGLHGQAAASGRRPGDDRLRGVQRKTREWSRHLVMCPYIINTRHIQTNITNFQNLCFHHLHLPVISPRQKKGLLEKFKCPHKQ